MRPRSLCSRWLHSKMMTMRESGSKGSRKGHQGIVRHIRTRHLSVVLLYTEGDKDNLCINLILHQSVFSPSVLLSVCFNCSAQTFAWAPCRLMKFTWVVSFFNSSVQITGYSCMDRRTHTPISLSLSTLCLKMHPVTAVIYNISLALHLLLHF